MNVQEQQKPQTTSCLHCQSINDENNNNFSKSICTNCERQIHDEATENQRMINVPDTSSDDDDDEYWGSSYSSVNDSEVISLDTRKLWHDIAHIIKCIYRETNREFTANHSTSDLCKAKEYVQILTELDSECLFNRIQSIVLEYIDEIRNQVLQRFQTCSKTSNDVQLLISYLLDEYNTFIQAANNVSSIVSHLEEQYMKSFHLTWLLYNKHLYEKLVYMDKKIHQSMFTMIDLLQPSHDDKNEYSPAEYTQLLNRFLAFDEEMSEVGCLYKNCQIKMSLITQNSLMKNQHPGGIVVTTKKTKRISNTHGSINDNLNSTTTNAVDIPLSNNSSTTPVPSQQGSNGSSIGSGVGGKESSSVSSFDEYLLDNNTSSSSYTKEESDQLIHTNDELHEQLFHGILNNSSPMPQIQHEIDELKFDDNTKTTLTDSNQEKQETIANETNMNDEKKLSNGKLPSTKKSKTSKSSSNRRKESTITPSILPRTSLTPDMIFPPKPPSSTTSKIQADFRSLTKTEMSTCPSLLSAQMQSVSFLPGTFGSITTNESSHFSSINKTRLNINLSRRTAPSMKTDSAITFNQLRRQGALPSDVSTFLSSLDSAKLTNELQKSSFNDKTCDFCCCCDLYSELNSSSTTGCGASMSLPHSTTINCAFHSHDADVKERSHLKLTKRTTQNPSSDQPKVSSENKSRIKQCDNNIDDLVRFIDGNEITSDGSTSKKNKKKKDKQSKQNSANEDTEQEKPNKSEATDAIVDASQPLSKRKQKAKLKLEQQQKQAMDESLTIQSSTSLPPLVHPSSPKRTDSSQAITEPTSENSPPPPAEEEEVNWTTISRKQSKHKPTPVIPSLLSVSNNAKPKRQETNVKTKNTNTLILAQQKVIPEIVPNSNKQQHTTTITPVRVQNPVKTQQPQKIQPSPAWTTREEIQVTPSSTLLATAPVFVPAASLVTSNQTNDTLPLEEPLLSCPYWNSNDYLPPGPVQRPSSSFLLARGPLHPTTSRCIQRPSPEPRTTTSFPTYSPMNYTISDSASTWNDSAITNPNGSQWKDPHEEQFQSSTIPNDFPLYDPFNSGTGLPNPSSILHTNRFKTFKEHVGDLQISPDNDADVMDALDKEIEDFKKCYIDSVPCDPREKHTSQY